MILDEPGNRLDPAGIRCTRTLLQSLAASGRTVLVSSHQLAEVEQLADDLVVIAAGRVVASGRWSPWSGRTPGLRKHSWRSRPGRTGSDESHGPGGTGAAGGR